jgi:hypothetical protein
LQHDKQSPISPIKMPIACQVSGVPGITGRANQNGFMRAVFRKFLEEVSSAYPTCLLSFLGFPVGPRFVHLVHKFLLLVFYSLSLSLMVSSGVSLVGAW